MKTNRIQIFLAFLILSMSSCTEKVDFKDLNIKYVDRVVIDGLITTEKKEHKVLIYHSVNLNSSDSSRMEVGATVSVSDGRETILLSEKQRGVYTTSNDFAGMVDKTYKLNVTLKNGDEYTASCYLYPSMVVDTLYSTLAGGGYDIYLKAHQAQGRGAACMIDLYANDSLLTSYLKEKPMYAMGSFYESIFSIPSEDLAKDTSIVKMRMYSMPYQMFQYIRDVGNETWWSAEIFRTSPANVRTNISNGGLGFFCASDMLEKQIVVVK